MRAFRFGTITIAPSIVAFAFCLLPLIPQVTEIYLISLSANFLSPAHWLNVMLFGIFVLLIFGWSAHIYIERVKQSIGASINPTLLRSESKMAIRAAFRRCIWVLSFLAVWVALPTMGAIADGWDCQSGQSLGWALQSVCAKLKEYHLIKSDVIGFVYMASVLFATGYGAYFLKGLVINALDQPNGRLPVWFLPMMNLASLSSVGVCLLFSVSAMFQLNLFWSAVDTLGSVGVIMLFFCGLMAGASWLARLYIRKLTRWPWLLLACWTVSGLIDGNDIYFLRVSAPDGSKIKYGTTEATNCVGDCLSRESFAAGLMRWLDARRDRIEAFNARGRKYPIYIVSAQGGGLFAAYQSAYMLSGIQDRCPAFLDHLFAISVVSGGAVGASAFLGAAVLAERPREKDCRIAPDDNDRRLGPRGAAQIVIKEFFRRDFLAPALAMGLFADIPRMILPLGLFAPSNPEFFLSKHDRATVFEDALHRYWSQMLRQKNLNDGDIENWWHRRAFSSTLNHHDASLYVNSTIVETGARLVLAPYEFLRSTEEYENMAGVGFSVPITWMTNASAAYISARFPFVAPAARLRNSADGGAGEDFRVVDAAYYDNSGAITAREVADDIRKVLSTSSLFSAGIEVRLLSFSFDATSRIDSRYFGGAFSDVFAPARALGNVRAQRALHDVEVAQRAINITGNCRVILFPSNKPALPLAWVLSDRSYRIIESLSGWGNSTEATSLLRSLRLDRNSLRHSTHPNVHCPEPRQASDIEFVSENVDTLRRIERDLSGVLR